MDVKYQVFKKSEEKDVKIKVKAANDIENELRVILQERSAPIRAYVDGAIWGLSAREQTLGIKADTSISWVLAAHRGTLEKLSQLLTLNQNTSSIELLSVTRNLFENLVWLRLFGLGSEWGLRFYGRLLQDEIEDLQGLQSKIEAEAILFNELAKEDTKLHEAMLESLKTTPNPSDDLLATAQEKHSQAASELDARARRTFAIYAAAATLNGYSYQAYLLENNEKERLKAKMADIEARLKDFQNEVADEKLEKKYRAKFNWRNEAERVGMGEQYDYLYRLTSRLLHSSPMNIVTEKQLNEAERSILLEFLFIGVSDALDIIENYDFPDRLNLAIIDS